MKILHILPDLEPGTFTRELRLLLSASQGTAVPAHVCCLASEGPMLTALRSTGAGVEVLGWRRWLDPRPLLALARRAREYQPDMIHVYGLAALRAVHWIAKKRMVAVSHPLHRVRGPAEVSAGDRRLLQSVAGVFVGGSAEAQRCRAAGVLPDRLRIVPPGVAAPKVAPPIFSPASPSVVCLGALCRDKGFREAVWTMDVLHYTQPSVDLWIAGAGPERRRLELFARGMAHSERIHFLSGYCDVAEALARASIVWVPSLTDTGVGVVLEAMAAGRPVIAARWPSLAELVVDGATGILVSPGDKMDLARQTRILLDDVALCRRLGAAARRRVDLHYGAASFVTTWFQHCHGLAASAISIANPRSSINNRPQLTTAIADSGGMDCA
jgi:glycosyltransferase involved in cell wall biosynthesis